ncbi:Lipid A core-like protein [Ignavibacterium album JCM 16511]|uniref:Lipid A core-like protein n=1 Tax=Ignavibacterium album (strain DSM 19864 / JCM 16511 / NBRC 101810 / Mat9-16) TaxID=945713 RepID=I0AMG3_IGNAJ|nr:O-antigen ligase family protein [Ignavibacterium album]AFH50170.1 Lipid A core-like protein [Ignavibacterium album JCM 16511]
MGIVNTFKNIKITRIITDIKVIAYINFFLLSFFVFLGTEIPFQERFKDAYEAETTNIINQVVYISLFFSSLYVSFQIYIKLFYLVRKEKLLSFFIFLCLISFIWSDYPLISFKRSFQLIVTFLTIINSVILNDEKLLVKLLIIVSTIYLIINYFSGIFIAQAIDPSFGTWRGIELHKNLLGYSSLIISIIAIWRIIKHKSRYSEYFGFFLLFLSIGLIILSYSTTNILAISSTMLIFLLSKIKAIFKLLGIKKFIFNFLIISIIILSLILSIYSKELIASIPAIFGKDASLTGRDIIWVYIWNEIQKRPILGYGYGTYWIMGTHIIDLFTAFVGWRVNEAHNGFLEIALQLGITGFSVFILTYFSFIIKALKQDDVISLIAISAITLVNFSESFIFTPRDPSTLLFILLYLKLVFKNSHLDKKVFYEY